MEKNYYELHKNSILQQYKQNRYARILYSKKKYNEESKEKKEAQINRYYSLKFTREKRIKYIENKFRRQEEQIQKQRLKWLQENQPIIP